MLVRVRPSAVMLIFAIVTEVVVGCVPMAPLATVVAEASLGLTPSVTSTAGSGEGGREAWF